MMKLAVVFDHILNQEVEINIYQKLGLKPGDAVFHKNAGKFGGAGPKGCHKITSSRGIIKSIDFHGEDHCGSQVYTAVVVWEDGESYMLNCSLLTKGGFR